MSGALFMVFSACCGSSTSVLRLQVPSTVARIAANINRIIFRAFQGLGGAGMYSVPNVVLFQLVPGSRYAMINSISASLMALAFLLGPLIGGAISETSNWRWIFYFKYVNQYTIEVKY